MTLRGGRPGRANPDRMAALVIFALAAAIILGSYMGRSAYKPSWSGTVSTEPARPAPPPQHMRFVHGPVNIRSGPGTQYAVVRQAQRFEPLWVGVADSTGWTAVYKQRGSPDTMGFVLARLLHMDPKTPAEIEAEKEAMRRAFVRILEERYLDEGYDIRVYVRGERATTLVLEYVLFNRVWAHQLEKEADFWREMRKLGFKRVEMRDGYYFSTAWVLN